MRWTYGEIKSEIVEAIFPSNIYCILCGSLIDRTRPYSLCDECVREIHWITGGISANGLVQDEGSQRTCMKCGKALQAEYQGRLCYDCMELKHYFTKGFSCMTYGLHEREIMMDIKYHDKAYIASKMGDILFDRMRGILYQASKHDLRLFDCVIPVPISEGRRMKRGYNQAELMAAQMIRRWKDWAAGRADGDIEYGEAYGAWSYEETGERQVPRLEKNILIRAQETEMLRSLNPAERRLALDGAFKLKEGAQGRIKDKNILLIDDVYTTGATADACSKLLLENGAKAVYLLTLASGGNRKKDEEEKIKENI